MVNRTDLPIYCNETSLFADDSDKCISENFICKKIKQINDKKKNITEEIIKKYGEEIVYETSDNHKLFKKYNKSHYDCAILFEDCYNAISMLLLNKNNQIILDYVNCFSFLNEKKILTKMVNELSNNPKSKERYDSYIFDLINPFFEYIKDFIITVNKIIKIYEKKQEEETSLLDDLDMDDDF